MKKNIIELKKYIILILVAAFVFWGINNLNIIGNIFGKIFIVFKPFLLGCVIAFVLNMPMKKIELFLKKVIKTKNNFIRVTSIVLSLLLFIILILFVALLLIPELVENIRMLINNIPSLIDKVEIFIVDLIDKYPELQKQIIELFSKTGNINDLISNVLNYFVNGAIGFVSNLVSGFMTIFMAILFSIYILFQKEYLITSCKKIIYAITTKKNANKIIKIINMTKNTFSKFLFGQCLDAVILGCLMFVAFSIFKFPYTLLISVLTAVTALIPIFGALIAMIIGFILIAITNPIDALIFVIVFLVIQQIEGNFIYPRVVGKSVGLSSMWTLLSITVGGNLFGIAGMLIGLPLTSVIYVILKDVVNNKLKEKEIKIV